MGCRAEEDATVAYVLGHGERSMWWRDTFVPSGRSISFLALPGEYATFTRAVEVLSAGETRGLDTIASPAGGPCRRVPNYELSPLSSAERTLLGTVLSAADARIYWVGVDVPAGRYCTAGCSPRELEHRKECLSLFNVVTEPDVLAINCRVLREQDVLGSWLSFARPPVRYGETHDDHRSVRERIAWLIGQRRHLDAWQALQLLPATTRALVTASNPAIADFVRQMDERAGHGASWRPDPDSMGVLPFRQGAGGGDVERGWRAHLAGARGGPPLPVHVEDCLGAWQNVFLSWLQESDEVPLALHDLVLLTFSDRRSALQTGDLDRDATTPAALWALQDYADEVERCWSTGRAADVVAQLGLDGLAGYPDVLGKLVEDLVERWTDVLADAGRAELYLEAFVRARAFVHDVHTELTAALNLHLVPLFRAAVRRAAQG
ncbi:hypothetical protein UK23_31100 [Lentzea aerocolonigenes]|uniref:Uncharacterized protein n=1 Tax=Lentzea aerocolonigenes TaxID=68170 RepID=A0A0F0GPW9_LENAE|nr:hypothetical protein [Lentzea aerocolonigenes]KJK43997.1 hypothetical protein UK23_31100 [Lentzea aerocolonigenes]